MKKKSKISTTAYRVLLLFSLLNKKDYNVEELMVVFSKDQLVARSFSKEVILKYLHTLNSSGFCISKYNSLNKSRYTITKCPYNLGFTLEDVRVLFLIDSYLNNIYQDKIAEKYSVILSKIKRYVDSDLLNKAISANNDYSDYFVCPGYKNDGQVNFIKCFEKYCFDDLQVEVSYKLPTDKEVRRVIIEPKSIKYKMQNAYLCGYNVYSCERQMLLVDYVLDIKQLPQKSRNKNILPTVVFKLKGRLVKAYRPYENDKVLEREEDNSYIVVSSSYDDKAFLYQRLLRYGNNCEILYPKTIRSEFKQIVIDTLSNYAS